MKCNTLGFGILGDNTLHFPVLTSMFMILIFWYVYIFYQRQQQDYHYRLRHLHHYIIITMFSIIIVMFLYHYHHYRSMHWLCLWPDRNKDGVIRINGVVRNLLPRATEYREAKMSGVIYNMKKSPMKCHSACNFKVIPPDSRHCLQRSNTEHFDTPQVHHYRLRIVTHKPCRAFFIYG